jgi:HK97 family phage portal protein
MFKVVDESALKAYKAIVSKKDIDRKEFNQAIKFKKQALEPIDNFNLQLGKLNDLLKYPNELESWSDFMAYGCLFKLITGDKYIWGDTLTGGANKGIPNMLWNLPSQFMTIFGSMSFPQLPVSYKLFSFNQEFTKEQILHELYPNPQWTVNGGQLYGMSPLKAAIQGVITRNNSAKIASASKFQNGGLDTILYMDDQRFDADQGLKQAQALKGKLATEYSGERNQGKLAISGIKVGAVPLGLSPVELGIIESEKWDMALICNLYGVPSQMMNDDKASRNYNNTKEAEKALTNRSALPLLCSFRDQLNRKLQTDWGFKGVNVFVDFDMTVYSELQENMKDSIDGTAEIILITPNEQREIAGMKARPEPEADELWVMQGGGRVPLSDYQATTVDNTLNSAQNAGNNNTGQNGSAANGQAANNGSANGKGITKTVSYS